MVGGGRGGQRSKRTKNLTHLAFVKEDDLEGVALGHVADRVRALEPLILLPAANIRFNGLLDGCP
jgi:hypothetical protein